MKLEQGVSFKFESKYTPADAEEWENPKHFALTSFTKEEYQTAIKIRKATEEGYFLPCDFSPGEKVVIGSDCSMALGTIIKKKKKNDYMSNTRYSVRVPFVTSEAGEYERVFSAHCLAKLVY